MYSNNETHALYLELLLNKLAKISSSLILYFTTQEQS